MEKESRYASSTEMVVENHFLLSAHFTDHDLTVAISAHRFSQIANQNRIFCTKRAVSTLNVPETVFR
ncbi:TPA: hypothetical protein I7221_04480 [Vibrio vulnificus]|nr:hypothetical protein [Vibrio vulnificus]